MNPAVYTLAGHSGLNIFGQYTRNDKQSPQVPPGIYEGEFNRIVAAEIAEELQEDGITAQFLNPGPIGLSKKSIIGHVNDTCRRATGPLCLLEIHANSDDVKRYDETGWYDENGEDNDTGYTIFVCNRASSTSRKLAAELDAALQAEDYKIPSRGVKEANFTIITRTKCPAILIECGFMSNLSDVVHLQDVREIKKLCRAVCRTIKAVYKL